MATEIQELKNGRAVFMCNTTGIAFGPVMTDVQTAGEFEQHLLRATMLGDVRRVPLPVIEAHWDIFRGRREEPGVPLNLREILALCKLEVEGAEGDESETYKSGWRGGRRELAREILGMADNAPLESEQE